MRIEKEIIQKISKRSLSRLIAVQTLYQYNYYPEDKDILDMMDDIVEDYVINPDLEDFKSYKKKVDLVFLRNLLSGFLLVSDKIDEKISGFLEEKYTIDTIPEVLLQILRLGVFEINFVKDTPSTVVVSEYVDIANAFFDRKKVNFANAILDKASR